MTAWAYCIAYNEAPFIGYWVRHHRTFCEKVIVYVDTDTDDTTAKIVHDEGGEPRPYYGSGYLDDEEFVAFANYVYPSTKADWVIWLDADELLYHHRMIEHLDELHAAGVNLPSLEQFVMSSSKPPTHNGQVYDDTEYRNGIFIPRAPMGDLKVAIFDPNTLAITWGLGKHKAATSGNIVEDDASDPIKLLHYRWMGEEYLRARDARNYSRLSQHSKSRGYGYHTYPGFVGPYSSEWPNTRPDECTDVLTGPVAGN